MTKRFVILFLGVLFFSDASAKTPKPKKKKAAKTEIRQYTPELQTKIEALQLEAERAKFSENYEEALAKYQLIIDSLDKENDNAYYQMAIIELQSKRLQNAEINAEQAVRIDPNNKWYTELLAKVYIKSGNTQNAIKTLEQVIQQNPMDADNYFDLAYLYLQNSQPLNAVKTYDAFEKNYGIEESVTLQKEKIYLRLNQLDNAVNEIKKLIDAYPDEVNYLGMLAELYSLNGKKDKANEVYQQILEIDPQNPQALLASADIDAANGDTTALTEGMRKIFANPNMSIDAKVKMLYPYIQYYEVRKDKIKEAQGFSDILIATHPAEAKAHAIRGDLYYIDGQDDSALVSYNKALELKKDVYAVWQQLLSIYSSKRDWKMLLEKSDDALELFPNQSLIYYFKGNAEVQLKLYDAAVKTFTKGEKMSGDNGMLRAQLLANLGDAYHELQNHAASDSAYEKSLKYNPDNAYALNNYAYYLSLRKTDLEKAKEMSARSNKLEPGNDSFEDTYAWILFQLEDYKEAKVWQEKAIKSSGDKASGTLLEHYGDILFRLGETDAALEQWQKAKDAGVESITIEKKIAEKTYIE